MDSASHELLAYREATQKIKNAILHSQYRVIKNANTELLSLYYNVGQYISTNTRSGKWGTGAIESISVQLQGELPGLHGFSPSNMKNMRIFFEQWTSELEPQINLPDADISNDNQISLIRQLPTAELGETKITAFFRVGFTHHREILRKCKNVEERWYYILRCADEFWTVANLKNRLRADDFASFGSLPNNFKLAIPNGENATLAARSFRDEYLLDYIDIKESDDYDERDVGNAIVTEIKKFILTMGDGFCFIGNEYRLIVDEEEFFIDLLLFNRNLQCLVAFELKIDKFQPEYLGKMDFYLEALDREHKKANENPSIGVILCTDKDDDVVEIAMSRSLSPLMIAEYKMKLIDKKLLEQKLKEFRNMLVDVDDF
jgi:predicted nuclease of restriction endonuclease-like (RecB) superfamily